VLGGVGVTVGGRPVALRVRGLGRLGLRPGQAGLHTTRAEVLLGARVAARGAVVVRDETYPGTVGWRAVVVRPGHGTAVGSDVPSADPTRGLRVYPSDVLKSPADRRVARLSVAAGHGTVAAPDGDDALKGAHARSISDGLSAAFADAAAGRGVLVFLLLAAFGWGALHALSPGHGKAMVAAYLVGTRGSPRHALALGGIVTLAHTIGVFALGGVTLALSAYVVPEDLYPWLNLVSGLLVVSIGTAVLRSRLRRRRHHAHGHHHHHHPTPDTLSLRSLLAVGVSGGLLPCPSALVVLLAAISLHRIAFGLVLILAFSAGLALTITGIGLAAVLARGAFRRVGFDGPLVRLLPAASAAVILAAGLAMTLRAVPKVS
jgi:nickel/cobalt exporter